MQHIWYEESDALKAKARSEDYLGNIIEMILKIEYCIHVNSNAVIGLEFRLVHPMCISIAECEIGTNFIMYQCCTVDAKSSDCLETQKNGGNVTMYSGNSITGSIEMCDGGGRCKFASNPKMR